MFDLSTPWLPYGLTSLSLEMESPNDPKTGGWDDGLEVGCCGVSTGENSLVNSCGVCSTPPKLVGAVVVVPSSNGFCGKLSSKSSVITYFKVRLRKDEIFWRVYVDLNGLILRYVIPIFLGRLNYKNQLNINFIIKWSVYNLKKKKNFFINFYIGPSVVCLYDLILPIFGMIVTFIPKRLLIDARCVLKKFLIFFFISLKQNIFFSLREKELLIEKNKVKVEWMVHINSAKQTLIHWKW